MSELEESLGPDEKLVFSTHPSRLTQPFFYAAAIVVLLFFLLTRLWLALPVALAILGYGELKLMSRAYHFTNQQIIQETGLFSKDWIHVPYGRITDLRVKKSFVERLFDLGTIGIDTSGTGDFEESIDGVRDPERIESFIHSRISEGK